MPPKVIKLTKKDDIASAIKKIKTIKEKEIVFELSKGAKLLGSSDNLKLLKRSGEVAGKKVLVHVDDDDEMGKILAKKAGVLEGDVEVKPVRIRPKVARSDVKPKFSDIQGPKGTAVAVVGSKLSQQVQKFSPSKLTSIVKVPSLPSLGMKKPSRHATWYFLSGLAAIVIAALALAVFLPQATVTIYARSEPIQRDFELTVNRAAQGVDRSRLVIPGIDVNKEVSKTEQFAATGTGISGTKAQGSVQLYNFTPYTLTLKAATTTLVVDGKKYFFTRDVTGLRPTGGSQQNPDESTLIAPVPVVAELGGTAHNLPANTRFEIQNQALGDQPVYAINPEAISGGASDNSTVVTAEDLDVAAEKLASDILAQIESDLSQVEGVPVALIDSGVQMEILARTSNQEVGAVANNFDMTLIARVTGLAFRQSDVTNTVLAKINEVLSDDKYLLTDNGQTKYSAEFKSLDVATGQGVLAVHFETVAAYQVDEDDLSKLLAGKNETEIKEILLSKPEVDEVKVEFWPSWLVHKAPKFNGKVYINTVVTQ